MRVRQWHAEVWPRGLLGIGLVPGVLQRFQGHLHDAGRGNELPCSQLLRWNSDQPRQLRRLGHLPGFVDHPVQSVHLRLDLVPDELHERQPVFVRDTGVPQQPVPVVPGRSKPLQHRLL